MAIGTHYDAFIPASAWKRRNHQPFPHFFPGAREKHGNTGPRDIPLKNRGKVECVMGLGTRRSLKTQKSQISLSDFSAVSPLGSFHCFGFGYNLFPVFAAFQTVFQQAHRVEDNHQDAAFVNQHTDGHVHPIAEEDAG